MNIGLYFTLLGGLLIASAYSYCFGSIHKYFVPSALLYTLGSVSYSYSVRLNVDRQLDFDYSLMVTSEIAGFTAKTLLQAVFIRLLGIDPILSFGIATAVAGFVHIVPFLLTAKTIDSSVWLIPLETEKVQKWPDRYLLPNTLKFGVYLAYTALLNDFFDNSFFVLFGADLVYLGAMTLIRGFGSLFSRFIFAPINNITYNLYAKLILEASQQQTGGDKAAILDKLKAIIRTLALTYTTLIYFFLLYGSQTSEVLLSFLFGSQWVTPVILSYQELHQSLFD